MRKVILLAALALMVPLAFYGCSGNDGATGANGAAGLPGAPGTPGTPGPGGTALVADMHGPAAVAAEEPAKYMVNIKITSATADAAGVATVNFTVEKASDNSAVIGIPPITAGIFKLAPAGGGLSYNRWVPYIYRVGRTVNAGYREGTSTSSPGYGTLVDHGDGSYTYTFKTNLSTATYAFPINNVSLVGYDRSLTHRVSVYMGGHSGPTGEGDFDFVPNGSAVTQTRNIVQTASCKKCHGPDFAGHGGDRVTVQGCNGCHSPNSAMVNSPANGGTTESIEMAAMIHKIHAGHELPSSQGPDGQFYDNPYTGADETADNYHIGATPYAYTVGSLGASWRTAAFPAVLANCEACHTSTSSTEPVENVDNWKTVPSRVACGSCHDTTSFAAGSTSHGAYDNDSACAACHPASGSNLAVANAHNWTTKDERNISEYNVAVTVSAPTNGEYFVDGETPVISIALTDNATGTPVAPNSVIQDPTAEGCGPVTNALGITTCNQAKDGLFTGASVYVTGPRAQRIPVLTYAARAAVRSANAGPWDLSAGGTFTIVVDSGMPMVTYDNAFYYEGYGADVVHSGTITVTVDNTGFANPALATPTEVAAKLNADVLFGERAVAYVDEARVGNANAGKLAIRSRGISKMELTTTNKLRVVERTAQPNVRVLASPPGIFATTGDASFGVAGGAVSVRIMTNPANTDPKANFPASGAITYTLDPVDDLVPGTYVINVEYADRGRGPSIANGGINPPEPPYIDYVTPSVAVATFQVKQAAPEKPIADGCTACHWSDADRGFVLDFPRHHKIVNEQAVDQCGGCHMYKSGMNAAKITAAGNPADFGTKPLSRRTHAFHAGSTLNYPTLTVGHEETSAFGRNWRITYPMDLRNCESCHPVGPDPKNPITSGTWKTNPNRLACMGCHDSDAATAHMKLQTVDPTPLAPFSGDEQESCKACH